MRPRLLSMIGALAAALAVMPAANAAPPLLSGLVAWWNAEGHANDIQGGNDAAIANVAIVPGKHGRAFSFDGTSNNQISILKTPSLNLKTSDFTIDAWINIPQSVQGSTNPNDQIPIFLNYGGVPTYMLMVKTAGFKAHVSFRPGYPNTPCATCTFAEATGTKSLNDGEWHHLAGVRRGTTVAIYVDGQLDGPINDFPAVANYYGGLVHVGCIYARIGAIHTDTGHCGSKSASWERRFHGLIDEVRVFNRALSPAEIQQLAQWTCSTTNGTCPAN